MTSREDRDHQSHAETREQGADHRPGFAGPGGFSDVPHAGQGEEATTEHHRHGDEPAADTLGSHVENPSAMSNGELPAEVRMQALNLGAGMVRYAGLLGVSPQEWWK